MRLQKSVFCILVAALGAASCGQKSGEHGLSEQQIKDGWIALFDGETTNGWRTYQRKENNSWEVAEGLLHCKPFADKADNKRADLVSNEEYSNFELEWEWKISGQGNSGVIYRATEVYNEPYQTGPEYQMLDDAGNPGDTQPWQKTGACYAMYSPSNAISRPAGEWNTSRLVVNANHVEHWLNGVKALEYEFGSDEWRAKKTEGKWKDSGAYGLAKNGRIDLQDHGSEVWFRSIVIRKI